MVDRVKLADRLGALLIHRFDGPTASFSTTNAVLSEPERDLIVNDLRTKPRSFGHVLGFWNDDTR